MWHSYNHCLYQSSQALPILKVASTVNFFISNSDHNWLFLRREQAASRPWRAQAPHLLRQVRLLLSSLISTLTWNSGTITGFPALYILTFSWKPCTALLFFFFDENALQLCPGRGSGGSDPHALRACCATAWHRQVNKQTINKTSGNLSLNDWLASVLGLSQLVSFRSLVAACSQGDIGRVRRLLDEVAKVFSDWDALLSFILLYMQATIIANQGRVSVHETTEDGESLLSLACSAGYYELAQVML